jgi:diguanylate cyclase (GGDEF)-like protein
MFVSQTVLPGGLSVAAKSEPWQFLLRLNQVLTAETTPIAMMHDVLEALHEVPEIESSWIAKPDAIGRVSPLASFGDFVKENAEVLSLANVIKGPYSEGPAGRSWRSGRPEVVDDWQNDPGLAIWQPATAHLNIRSAAAVPLRGRTGHHSLLVIYCSVQGFFSSVWTTDFLSHLAALIGNALENREKHAALYRAQRLYQTLFNGADKLLSTTSEGRLLRQFCDTLVLSGLFVSAGIGIVGADGRHRHLAAAALRHANALRSASFPFTRGQSQRPLTLDAWETGRTSVANEYFSNPRFTPTFPLARKLGFKSIVGLILRRGGTPWAVMSVSAAEEHYFDEELIQLLERMAALVGHALDEIDLKATLRREREAQSLIARQDCLTALPNRLAFRERLQDAIAHGADFGIGMIDLDDFKHINDQFGHAAGDTVLRVIAHRIRAMLRESDFMARLGGDEFALILESPSGSSGRWPDAIESFCGRLREEISAPVRLPDGAILNISLSAGFTIYPLDNGAPDLLVRHADMALYAAKSAKGQSGRFWRLYEDGKLSNDEEYRSRCLLREGALKVHFQPVLNLDEEKIVAVEALARLCDGAELSLPGKFLPHLTLEDRCLLFHQMLDASVAQLLELDELGLRLNVSVNLDAQVLLQEQTLRFIKTALARTGIAPDRLVLEILETHDFLDLKRAASQIKAVRTLGIRTALDDLGAGYSSILKIRELPFDVVKLDRAFVAGLHERPDDLIFVSLIQTFTAAMKIKLIVEGVEDESVLDALRMVGVRHVQGYVVAPPMSGGALADWLQNYRPRQVSKTPETLLGAYALHTIWIRLFEFLRSNEPLLNFLLRNNPYSLRGYFAGPGSRYHAASKAYQALETILHAGSHARITIQEAAANLRIEIIAGLKAGDGQHSP